MDIILPFMLDNGFSRGAFISADKTVADVLACHSYPKVVENVLGEAILLALALAGNIKFNGIFSFNVRGDGAVKRLFVSVTNDKKVRAYADFDAEHLPTAESPTNQELFGKGELLFSVAQLGQEPYQGIVQLTQTSLKETVSDYFRLSEQIKTDLVLRVKEGRYRCLVLQEMPHKDDLSATECADLWETQTVLLESVQDSELFDDSLQPENILYRLFHANKVTVFPKTEPCFSCPCHRSQMEKFLKTLSEQERESLYQDGKITVECQFCGNKFIFEKGDF